MEAISEKDKSGNRTIVLAPEGSTEQQLIQKAKLYIIGKFEIKK